MKLCTIFGDYFTPDHVQFQLEKAILKQYKRHNIKHYICGNCGNFDVLAQQTFSILKEEYPELKLILLQLNEGSSFTSPVPPVFDGIYRPVLKDKGKHAYYEYRHILDMSDCAVCHTHNFGNIRYLYEYALEREMRGLIEVYNLAGMSITMY